MASPDTIILLIADYHAAIVRTKTPLPTHPLHTPLRGDRLHKGQAEERL